MKKKFLCLLTSLILPLSLSLQVSGDTTPNITVKENNGTSQFEITGKLKSAKKDVYKVDVEWGSMEFTYTPAWDPENHIYGHHDEAWSCINGANEITVTNHSSAGVNVGLEYKSGDEKYSAITGSITKDADSNELPAATEVSGAHSLTATLTLKNALTDTEANQTPIGTVTVTISQPA